MNEETQERHRQSLPPYLRVDFIGGVLVCALAVLIWVGSAGLATGELRNFGPGFLPRIFSAVLLAGGIALVIRGLTQPDAAAEPLVLAFRGPLAVSFAIGAFAVFIKGYSLGPVAVPQLGLLVAGPITVFIAGMGSVEAEPRELLVLGIGLSALTGFVFADLLDMQVPIFPAIVADNLPLGWGPDWPKRIAFLAWLAVAAGMWRLFGLSFKDLKEQSVGEASP